MNSVKKMIFGVFNSSSPKKNEIVEKILWTDKVFVNRNLEDRRYWEEHANKNKLIFAMIRKREAFNNTIRCNNKLFSSLFHAFHLIYFVSL